MLRMATALVDDPGTAEDVVQDAFVGLYRRWEAIREPAAAARYVRVSVVNGARSVLRRRLTAREHTRAVSEDNGEAADTTVLVSAEQDTVHRAFARLPGRQREVLILRYVAELSDPEIAAATGLSLGGVRSASSRGLGALRAVLRSES
jgi:RNA polymerase sigma-70 factor (sigma-E family)